MPVAARRCIPACLQLVIDFFIFMRRAAPREVTLHAPYGDCIPVFSMVVVNIHGVIQR